MAFLTPQKSALNNTVKRTPTDEAIYLKRRRFLQALGLGSLGDCWTSRRFSTIIVPKVLDRHGPAFSSFNNNPHYQVPERVLSDESSVLSYNNFYEFSTHKRMVAGLARDFSIEPLSITDRWFSG